MNICLKSAAIVALGTASTMTTANTVDLSYTGNTGLNVISLSGGTAFNSSYYAGHLTHSIHSGPRAGQTFNTFCVEIAEYANNGTSTYEIVDLSEAPRSDAPDSASDNYGQLKADAVVTIIAKAIDLGWIDTSLQAQSGSTVAQMSAIQAMIWAALYESTASSSSSDVSNALSLLSAQSLNNTTYTIMKNRLRAVVADGEQDQLYVVPLPTSALAGAGLLGMCMGVRSVRRRR
ncbi:MAG: hypothetical protein P1U42_12550 [Phycisphaerales bacterium]|nr:hypothetical protein [Phycisphaerales bacterium]